MCFVSTMAEGWMKIVSRSLSFASLRGALEAYSESR
jgi:hypothetical protein